VQIYYLKQVAFEIVISDTQLKTQVTAVKKALGEIKGAGVNIKLNVTKVEIAALRKKVKDTLDQAAPIPLKLSGTANLVTNANSFAKGIEKAALNMEKFLKLIKESAIESATIRNNLGSSGGGRGRSNGINGGSRTGFTDSGGASLSAFSGFIRGGQSFTSQIGAYASGIGRLGIAAALPVAGIALLVRGMVDATTAMTEFGDKQAELAAISGTTRDGISQLTDQAIKLGASMSFTATEISGAQIELAKLGFTQSEILESTEGVARFAIVAGAKIPEAAEAAGAALQSFGLNASEMDRVVSVLGVSTAKSALDFEKLKVGIGTTFATAKTFGLEIEDVTALLGELSNKGLSASVSATATRNILLNLADGEGKLRRTLASLGVKEVKGLDGIVTALRTLNGAGIDLAQTFELTDKRSVNAFNAFLRGSDSLVNMRDSLVDVNGLFKIMEKERLNSLQGEMILFSSATERLNLLITDGMEPALQGALGAINDLINGFSDLLEIPIEQGIERQRKEFERLMNVLIDGNASYTVRKRIIDELNLKFPDLLKNIKLEELTTQELIDKLGEVNELYQRKKDFAVGESAVEKLLMREQKLIDEQIIALQKRDKLLSQANRRDELQALYDSPNKGGLTRGQIDELRLLNQALNLPTDQLRERGRFDVPQTDEINKTRSGIAGKLSTEFNKTGDVSVDSFKSLEEYRKAFAGGEQGSGLNETLLLLSRIEQKQREIVASVPLFDKKDFIAGKDGLSEVDRYLIQITNRLNVISNEDRAGGVEARTLQGIQSQLTDRQLAIRQANKPDLGFLNRRGKADPAAGSIDELELLLSEKTKEIDAVGDESLRNGLQREAEVFKKLVKEARAKLKADLEPTDEERIKLYNNFVDAQKDSNLRANEERFKDERLRSAVDLEIIKEAELKKLELRAFYQKKSFDDGTDKSGEYLNTLQEIENKKVEIVKAGEARVLVVGEISREMEVTERLKVLRQIYTNEEDFGKAKEALFLELEAAKIKAAVATGKVLSLVEQERLDGILDKITKINTQLGSGAIAEAAGFKANKGFNDAFSSLSEGGLSKNDIEKLGEIEADLAFEKNKEIIEDKLSRELLFSAERAELEKQYNDLIIQNQNRQYENKEKKEKEFWDIVKQGADIAGQISSELFNYQKAEQQARADSELETIDTIYEARLKAAEGNAAETERIEQEYQAAKKAGEKKAAEERRQIALKEAIVNLALSILKAAPNLVLMGVAAVIGGIQIATIRRQKFARGGYTGQGYGSPDETGEVPVGVVHAEEYVIPKWQVRKNPSLIRSLESDRLRGYASGGLVASSQQNGFNFEAMAAMADIIAARVGQSVLIGSMKGTEMGSEMGTGKGINRAARETASRDSARRVNTF